MKKRLFNIAWSIVDQFNSFAEALVHAWKVIKLQYALTVNALVGFTYKKVDGSIRKAIGTLKNIPSTTTNSRKVNYGVLTYFDCEQNAWRSAKVENLIFEEGGLLCA